MATVILEPTVCIPQKLFGDISRTQHVLTQYPGLGGEAVSLAIPYSQKASFAAAGYSNIVTNNSYIGGVVRQRGLFSFSRVFEAGHEGMPVKLF